MAAATRWVFTDSWDRELGPRVRAGDFWYHLVLIDRRIQGLVRPKSELETVNSGLESKTLTDETLQ